MTCVDDKNNAPEQTKGISITLINSFDTEIKNVLNQGLPTQMTTSSTLSVSTGFFNNPNKSCGSTPTIYPPFPKRLGCLILSRLFPQPLHT